MTGLDRGGRPLAGAAVDRWLSTARDGLGGGIALPFTMALLEYDLEPQQLALDVASGAVDLALEAELLSESDRRAVAEAEARRLAGVAIERIDADRIARRELEDLLGEATRPWLGTTLTEPDLSGALDEVVALATAGFDVLRVEVPIGRELADRLHDAGQDVPEWHPRERPDGTASTARLEPEETASRRRPGHSGHSAGCAASPTGWPPSGAATSGWRQRSLPSACPRGPSSPRSSGSTSSRPIRWPRSSGLASTRTARLPTTPSPAGCIVGPTRSSPSVPDRSSWPRTSPAGIPADAATRSGRALALQLVGVALTRADGIAADRIVVGRLSGVAARRAVGDGPGARRGRDPARTSTRITCCASTRERTTSVRSVAPTGRSSSRPRWAGPGRTRS